MSKQKYPSSKISFGDETFKLTWIKSSDIEKYKPIKQVYGIVFNDDGEILICRENDDSDWQIPGGTPEGDESINESLIRELEEEVDVEVRDIAPLGVQKVEPEESKGNDIFYQARYIAKLKNMNPITPDPDTGNTWQRLFISSEKINDYIDWGELGKQMFKEAIELNASK